MATDRANPAGDGARGALEAQARRDRWNEALGTEKPSEAVTIPTGGVTMPTTPTAAAVARAQLHERLERDFVYHPPGESARIRYAELREKARELAHLMVDSCPPGRELSTALTLLEQSNMMANAAIARAPL